MDVCISVYYMQTNFKRGAFMPPPHLKQKGGGLEHRCPPIFAPSHVSHAANL